MIEFEVEGAPVPASRPRITSRGNFNREPHVRALRSVGWQCRVAMQKSGAKRLEGPVVLNAVFVLEPPASLSKKKRAAMIGQPVDKRPDLDNYLKLIKDALNGIAYRDDGQVAGISVFKFYGEEAHTRIAVQPMQIESVIIAQAPEIGGAA